MAEKLNGNMSGMDAIMTMCEDFGPGHPKWDEWCKAQKESYERRSAKYDKAWA